MTSAQTEDRCLAGYNRATPAGLPLVAFVLSGLPLSLSPVAGSSIAEASILGELVDGILSPAVLWVVFGVVALVGIPWLVAGLALGASFFRHPRN